MGRKRTAIHELLPSNRISSGAFASATSAGTGEPLGHLHPIRGVEETARDAQQEADILSGPATRESAISLMPRNLGVFFDECPQSGRNYRARPGRGLSALYLSACN